MQEGREFDLLFVDGTACVAPNEPVLARLWSDQRTEAVARLLQHVVQQPNAFEGYDFLWAPTADVVAPLDTVNRLFRMHSDLGFEVAQPVSDRDSYFKRSIAVRHSGFSWREVTLIEPHAAIWASGALRAALEARGDVATDADAEATWLSLLGRSGGRFAMYDGVAITVLGQPSERDARFASSPPVEEVDAPEQEVTADAAHFAVLRGGDLAGRPIPAIDLSQRLTEGFPHVTTRRQTQYWRERDVYGLRHRRGLLRVAESQRRHRQILADVGDRRHAGSRRRNLVFLRAGEASLHPAWFTDEREFDLVVDAHGSDPSIYEGTCDQLFTGLAETGSLATHRLFMENPHFLTEYDAIWLPDDDIQTTASEINALFRLHKELGFDLAQPALSTNSYFTFSFLVQHAGFSVREVNYVESMVPVFTREAFTICLPTLAESRSAWGIDGAWPALLRPLGGRMAIYDCLPVRHTRPAGLRGPQGSSRDGALAELTMMSRKYDSYHLYFNEVTAGWDSNFEPIHHTELGRALLSGFPRTPRQRPLTSEPYLNLFLPEVAAGRAFPDVRADPPIDPRPYF